MFKFGNVSRRRLETADRRLQTLFNEVIKEYDHIIVCGHRNKAEQDLAFKTGKSKIKWPKGKHNSLPAKAIDAAPFVDGKVIWDEVEVKKFAKKVLEIAKKLKIKIRWGGDWDSNPATPNTFSDLVHFELVE